MASETTSKLNRLQQTVPEGLLVDAAWLERHGYAHPLRQKYVASGWLEMPARGVYRRPAPQTKPGEALDWQLVVISLQTLLNLAVSVGGRTSLEYQGLAHYLPRQGVGDVHLYASERLPGWLLQLPLNAKLVLRKHDRLFENAGKGLTSFSVNVTTGQHSANDGLHGAGFEQRTYGHWNWPLTLSTPERAILEMIDELPKHESFEQVDAIMGGLVTLRPRRLQRLLEACTSVKVKRLFLFLAERHNHPWLSKLDRKRIDLGAGKRALVEHGRYDPKYRITVPEFLLNSRDDL